MIAAGKIGSHQWTVRLSRVRDVIAPSSGAGAGSPRPRNDISDSVMMTLATSSDAAMSKAGTTPGNK